MMNESRGIFWEDEPAKDWMEAYPIGNGRQGAMIFGGCSRERVQLNLDSLWYGGHVDRINPEAKENLGHVRQLILEGKIPEAEEKLVYCFSGTPQSQRPYQTLGDLWITYGTPRLRWDPEDASSYWRELDLEKGVVQECFVRTDIGEIRKRYFASWPSRVIVVSMECLPPAETASPEEKGGGISFSAILQRGRFYERAGKVNGHTIFMDGRSGADGVKFYTAVAALAEGPQSRVQTAGEHLVVKNCRKVTLLIAGETSFYETDPEAAVKKRLDEAEKLGVEVLLRKHEEDYGTLFGRVRFHLGKKGAGDRLPASMPLHRRREEHPEDPLLAAAYYQFCRYLMIAGSRPDSLPLNLQGIWNEEIQPAWDSKYTININTEMNYWPAESSNLAECGKPLFDLIRRMAETGRDTARRMYGCRGFMAHHNTDIWADTAPQDIYIPATYWVMGGAWLCTHIMRHYRYMKDDEFLRALYPCLEEAVLFFEDFLIEDGGELVTCPSVSPENTYIMKDGTEGCICAGSTMDVEILTDLFTDYLEASEILAVKSAVSEKAAECLRRFPGLKIGKHGQIQEWREDYEEKEPGHRHISQLYALYPSNQISCDRTPALAQAAAATLERRLLYGGGHTGWSCAWIVCMYAKLEKGEEAYQNLVKLFRQSTAPNLMDTHPRKDGRVFQIDGNMGALAGMTEMLVHAEPGYVKLLPSLPSAWKDGEISGIRIMDGGQISLRWEDGEVSWYAVQAAKEPLCLTLAYAGKREQIEAAAGETVEREIGKARQPEAAAPGRPK